MSEVNEKLEEIKEFLEEGEGYSRDEVITDILGQMLVLNDYEADEIGLFWDDENLTDLQSFVDEFYEKVIEQISNVLESFEE